MKFPLEESGFTSRSRPRMTRAASCFRLNAFSSWWASVLFVTCLNMWMSCVFDTSLELFAMQVAVSSLSPVNIQTFKPAFLSWLRAGGVTNVFFISILFLNCCMGLHSCELKSTIWRSFNVQWTTYLAEKNVRPIKTAKTVVSAKLVVAFYV